MLYTILQLRDTILQLHAYDCDWSNDINEDEVSEKAPNYINHIYKIDDVESEVRQFYKDYKTESKDGVTGYIIDIDYILQDTWDLISASIRHATPAMKRLAKLAKIKKASKQIRRDSNISGDAFLIDVAMSPPANFILHGELMDMFNIYDEFIGMKKHGIKSVAITSAFDYHY